MKKPKLATIRIEGPTQCGKTHVAFLLRKMLQDAGCDVVFDHGLKQEENANFVPTTPDSLEKWEKEMLSNTIWYLSEGGNGEDNQRRSVSDD